MNKRRKRHNPEQIVHKLRDADAMLRIEIVTGTMNAEQQFIIEFDRIDFRLGHFLPSGISKLNHHRLKLVGSTSFCWKMYFTRVQLEEGKVINRNSIGLIC